jgi:asparagine synthase (glutamine-hydrolysing)
VCGIAGKLYFDREHRVALDDVRTMCDELVHRGPDDEGYHCDGPFGFGMRRLAIIDLDTGQQPICNEDRTIWVVLNGEIYNFVELRKQLLAKGHCFTTRTDTEVIVHLYEEEGDAFVHRLNGMFALALWDSNSHTLLLARDRLGVKPLYYAHLADRLVFGSEPKALLRDGLDRSVDPQALHHYLSLTYVPAPLTIFQTMRKLEAGHLLLCRDGTVSLRRYWDLPSVTEFSELSARQLSRLREELWSLLQDAVRIRLTSDVPLGVFLSGGIDSSTVLALVHRVAPKRIKTFSVGFNEASFSELRHARALAQHFNTDHHEFIATMNPDGILPVLARHFDEPFADASAIPMYYVSQMSRPEVTVALGGDGGDETFAGYYTYQADRLLPYYQKLPAALRELLPKVLRRLPVSDQKVTWELKIRRFLHGADLVPALAHYAWKEWLTEQMKQALYAPQRRGLMLEPTSEFFLKCIATCCDQDTLNTSICADTKLYLADDILVKVDRMSMANSLEVRGPLLDYRIVEFMSRIPGKFKMPGLRLKHLLKETVRTALPSEVLRRKKAGFNVPLAKWLRRELSSRLQERLSERELRREGFFDPGTVRRLLTEHAAGTHDWSRQLWVLLMFSFWYERYGTASR